MNKEALGSLKLPAILLIIIGALNLVLGGLTVISAVIRALGFAGEVPVADSEAQEMGRLVGLALGNIAGVLSLLTAPLVIYVRFK